MEDALRELLIANISIQDTVVEVQFIEKRDQGETAGLVKNLIMDRSKYSALIDEILTAAEELVDAGLLDIRHPPPSLDPRQRLATKDRSLESNNVVDGPEEEEES